jgi:hypothetical protein
VSVALRQSLPADWHNNCTIDSQDKRRPTDESAAGDHFGVSLNFFADPCPCCTAISAIPIVINLYDGYRRLCSVVSTCGPVSFSCRDFVVPE